MKKSILTLLIAGFIIAASAFKSNGEKLISKDGHISFFSHTVAEDITANNYKVVSTLDPSTGEVVFSVPMQSFEFEKALMQKHFNSSKFLNTKKFPKAKFKGTITNLGDIDFGKDGTYQAHVKGDLSIHGANKPIDEQGTVTVSGGKVTVNTKMNLTLADFDIAFKDGKPSTNIAKTIEVTVTSAYNSGN